MWLYWHADNPNNGDSHAYFVDRVYRPVFAYAYVVTVDGGTVPLTIDFRDDGVSMLNDKLAITPKHNLGTLGRFKSNNHIRQESVITMIISGSGGDAAGLTVGLKLEEV